MKKNTDETYIPAEATVNGIRTTLSIDGKQLAIPSTVTPDEAKETIRKRLVLTAKLKRTPIKASITEPDGHRTIIVRPDGETQEIENSEETQDRTSAPPLPETQTRPATRRESTSRRILMILVALVMTLALGAGGMAIHHMAGVKRQTTREQAYQTCNQARKDISKAYNYKDIKTRYGNTLAITTEQVKDPSTVRTLHRLMESINGRTPLKTCNPEDPPTRLEQAATDMRQSIDDRRNLYRSLDEAARAVVASRDAKILEDAKSALAGKRDEASKLLGDSDGKVADNATRDALQKAIDQAGKVTGGKAKDYQDAVSALQSAVDQVNASMQAKAQTDQQAADQAAQQQAAAQQQPAPSYGGGGYTPSYNRGGGSAPAPAPAPAPAAPSAPQGSWSVPPAGGDTNGSLPDHL